MVKIRIVVQENHPRQKKQQYPYIFIAQEFKPRFVLMWICHLMFLAPIEPISQVLTWIKGKGK
jgi:hypothetical protein